MSHIVVEFLATFSFVKGHDINTAITCAYENIVQMNVYTVDFKILPGLSLWYLQLL
jgi:hypothetical protein